MPREEVGNAYQYSEEATTTVIDVEGNGNETALFDEDDGGVTVALEPKEAKAKPAPKEDELEIEIVDDTPEADRNRKASPPPDDPTDDELGEYSEKVQKRIKKFTKGYHDERRAKESAERELAEAALYAQRLVEENKRLREQGVKSQSMALEQAKRVVENEYNSAKERVRAAHESGNTDEFMDAQEALITAKNRIDRLGQIRQPSLQEEQNDVQQQQPMPQADPKAVAWSKQNKDWFGKDEEMTAAAYGYHQKLINSGVDPRSDEYYEKLDSRMRQKYPEAFNVEADDDATFSPNAMPKSEDVVAPATRSVAPKRIKLTKTQVQLAKRLGVPLEMYAKQVAEEQRKQNNG